MRQRILPCGGAHHSYLGGAEELESTSADPWALAEGGRPEARVTKEDDGG